MTNGALRCSSGAAVFVLFATKGTLSHSCARGNPRVHPDEPGGSAVTPDRGVVMLDLRMSRRHDVAAPTTYEVLVRGELSNDLLADLGARRCETVQGKTVIFVDLIDQSHLRGVLARLQDNNLAIERVNPV